MEDTYIVHLNDEAPRIGSGVRLIRVLSLGWKWVKIENPCTGRQKKLSRSVWDELNATRHRG